MKWSLPGGFAVGNDFLHAFKMVRLALRGSSLGVGGGGTGGPPVPPHLPRYMRRQSDRKRQRNESPHDFFAGTATGGGAVSAGGGGEVGAGTGRSGPVWAAGNKWEPT